MKISNFVADLFLVTLTACTSRADTMLAPTATVLPVNQCAPTLSLDAIVFPMETINIEPDGSLPELADEDDIAYWINGTDQIFIFLLSPSPENLKLVSTLAEGSLAKVTWANCTSLGYLLSAPEPGSFEVTYLPDQSTSGIQIFILPDSAGDGFVINGKELEG